MTKREEIEFIREFIDDIEAKKRDEENTDVDIIHLDVCRNWLIQKLYEVEKRREE